MVEFTLKELLERIDKTPYWLAKQSGISYPTIDSIVKNTSKGIQIDTLDKICTALECEPGDIIKTKTCLSNQNNVK